MYWPSCCADGISIHTLHAEGDLTHLLVHGHATAFLSTPSMRRVTINAYKLKIRVLFLSTPSMRRVTNKIAVLCLSLGISIHTLHAEGDANRIFTHDAMIISIHTLHAEGDGKYDEKIAMVF